MASKLHGLRPLWRLPARWVLIMAIFALSCVASAPTLAASNSDMKMLALAAPFLPTLLDEQEAWWPDAPFPSAFAGQVEQESLWRQRAELKTAREHGAGFSQITKTDRFDALSELRSQFPTAFRGWGWGGTLFDARFQLRAVILMDLRNWRVITNTADDRERLAMSLAAYNGGLGGLSSDRRLCAATKGCDPSKWWGHVERVSLKARTVSHGYGQSFFCVNHRYASRVADRSQKYMQWTGGDQFVAGPNAISQWCKP